MTELDLKLQDLKNAFDNLKEENKRFKFSNSMLEKELQEYRQLEEQGLLLELPCKVWDKAYHIIEDNMADPPIYISEHEIQDVSAKAVYDEAGFSMEYNAVSVEDIKNAPAAYDVDKVVKEIKEVGTRFCCVSVHCNNECSNCDHGAIMKAIIEIVKGGGVNG